MNPRPLAVLALVAALAGCSSPDEKKTPPPGAGRTPEHLQVTRELLHTFRDEVYAHYELRLLADPAAPPRDKASLERELETARRGEESARERLIEALEAAGSKEAREAGKERLRGLVPIVRDALVRTGVYAFIIADPEGDMASFAVVRLVGGRQERTIELFGEKFPYELYVHDETIVEDYPTYRARQLAPPGTAPLPRPAVTLGRSIFIDLAAAARIGRESFFPRVDHYRELARQAEDDRFFAATAKDPAQLLAAVKELLRWRSLEPFWSTVRALPADDQGRRFAEDYEAREEVRAAAEAFELERAGVTGTTKPSPEKLLTIEQLAMLSAIVHGEPLGETATTVGLAGTRLVMGKPATDPTAEAVLRAAASVTAALVRELAPPASPTAPADDATDFARLARATPDQLRLAATALYRRTALPPPARDGKRPG